MAEIKVRVYLTHTAAGGSSARVVVTDGKHTGSWAEKCYGTDASMRTALATAEASAMRQLKVAQAFSEASS